MRNLWLVARREFVFRGKSGAYLVSTLMMVIALLLATMLPALIEGRAKVEPLNVLLLDKTGKVAGPLQAAMAAAANPGSRPISLTPVTGAEDALMERARSESKVLLIVEGSFPDALKARFLSGNPGDLSAADALFGPLDALARTARITARGLDPTLAQQILKPIETETAQLTAKGGQRDESQWLGSYLLAMGIVMCLYMVILINGQFVFMGVLEEKVSRVMEVMASSVSAGSMLAGKVVGLGALGLIQFVAMIIAWFAGSLFGNSAGSAPASAPAAGSILLALLFLVLGYLMTATLFAAGGALISRMEDQQVVLTPIVLLVAVPFMLLPLLMNNPNSTAAVVMSMIPFLSQSLMVFRMLMVAVPAWQIGLALLLMLLTALFTTWAGGRVYRAAMLSYGSRPSLRQVWTYLKAG